MPAKIRYHAKDLGDWARLYGLEIGWPSVFPVNSVKVMRGAIAADAHGKLPEWSRAAFEAYWGEDRDISQDTEIEALATRVGLDPKAMLAAIATPEIKAKLRENTDDLIQRGGFGSPTMIVDGEDLYFGNDRLPLLRAALGLR